MAKKNTKSKSNKKLGMTATIGAAATIFGAGAPLVMAINPNISDEEESNSENTRIKKAIKNINTSGAFD
jgi:hypothetical protein